MSESPKRGVIRGLATRGIPIRRIATLQIPTKPVVVAFFLVTLILVGWIGLASVQHHGLTREQCQHNKYYYWADGKCRAQGGPDPGPFG